MEIKKNQEYEVEIEDFGSDGSGIGKIGTFPLFIKDTVIGDKVSVKVIKVKKNYGYGRMMKLLVPSPDRVPALCSVARQCGGCTLQHLNYEKQLEYKYQKVKNCLMRIGGLKDIEEKMKMTLGMEEPFYYRNKAQYPVGKNKEGQIVTGFYAGRTHSIVENDHCCIQAKENDVILPVIKAYMKKNHIEPYDEKNHRGLVRHILTRVGFTTGEIMVCLVLNGSKKDLPNPNELIDALTKIKGMTSIVVNQNREKTNKILGKKIETLWGQDYIEDYIGNVKYQIGPLSFYQVNPTQTKVLYGKALDFAGLTGNEIVWDLYCGIGTISLFLAQKAKQVYGVEIVPEAIEDARKNAAINGIENVEFFVGKAEEVLPEKYKESRETMSADVIVVDPPRKGCEESLLDTIVKMSPEKVVYVSCDPATLARDLKYLCGNGYDVKKIQPVDMFGMSGHVETVVLLSQQKPDDTIEIDLDLDELDATSAELKATYQEIKDYVLKEFGLKVSNLYISQIKRKCGIEVGENYNLPKSENSKVPQCPKEKEDAIRAALKYFAMI
ncbi:MAG: 23S rRNA (uracil(1939)-C(5))-methyltransferase RlmD [Lachnospiraceae bacterium]|nr:23S rRNA (uracil(1939)-C(5))-methyltransferase RlmD [Lachnospiraceae bacterium]